MTLVLRKLLASSTFAIAGALTSISNRLKAKLGKQEPAEPLEDELDQDYEALDETAEEWTGDESAEVLTEADFPPARTTDSLCLRSAPWCERKRILSFPMTRRPCCPRSFTNTTEPTCCVPMECSRPRNSFFAAPSGCGKTLAAEIIAQGRSEIGLQAVYARACDAEVSGGVRRTLDSSPAHEPPGSAVAGPGRHRGSPAGRLCRERRGSAAEPRRRRATSRPSTASRSLRPDPPRPGDRALPAAA